MIKIIKDLIMDKWNDWDLGKRPKGIECLLLNHAKLNFVIFKKGDKIPCLLIKVSKDERLEAEFRNLSYINPILPRTTPKPYELIKLNGYYVFAEEFIAGKNLLYQSKREESINTAFKELIEFHKIVMSYSFILHEEKLELMIYGPVKKFMQHDKSDIIRKEIILVLKESEKLRNLEIFNIQQHCDFSFVNILFQKKGVKIIDWEDFGKTCLPLHDLFTLVNSLYFGPESFEEFTIKSYVNEIIKSNIIDYCNVFRIEKKLIKILFPISLITLFNNSYSFKARETISKLLEFYFKQKEKFFIMS